MTETVGSRAQAKILPPDVVALQAKFDQAVALHQQQRLADAERIYREVLQRQPNHFDALHLLGVIALQTGHMEQAADLISKAIELNANVAAAHSNLGTALRDLKRPESALASFDQAIALEPDFAAAHCNRGTALLDLGRSKEALASCDKAIALKPDFATAHNTRGLVLEKLKRPEEALASYDKAIALKPDLAEAYSNRGNVLLDLRRSWDALANYDTAIALKPDFAMAHNNRGMALEDLKRSAEALVSFDCAVALEPSLAMAHHNRGATLESLNRLDEALAAYDTAFTLNPNLIGVEGDRLLTKMSICDWRNFDSECAHLVSAVKNGKANTAPFPLLAIASSSADQLQCAKLWTAHKCPPSDVPIWQGERFDHDRIRVAYVSPDFREHATSFLMAGMFECHDKSRFEITAISCGPNNNSQMRKRLQDSFERFIDATTLSDNQIAKLLRELEIEILVDLAGFTVGSRRNILARRPAPISVSYLGYPGTSGAQYIDYIIADQTVIPPSRREFYSEKVVYLPNSYQVNDATRPIATEAPNRAALGLPLTGFVFCCFNNNYKVTARIFDCWMRMLKRVEGSVLWLFEKNAMAARHLKKEAVARGVDAERLIFAKPVLPPDHLARHRSADLFLDTLPCNAHTTASDALWSGLPVLTCLGETFAGRVAASLLHAVGLPELITTTLETYEQTAIDLAMNAAKLAAIKRKLAEKRLSTPLFDTKLCTKYVEAAYAAMYERHQAGLLPDHISIPN